MGNRKLNFTLTPKTWTPTNSNCFPFPFRVWVTGVLMYYLPKQSIRCMLYIHIHGPFMVYMYVPIPQKLLQHDADRFVVDTNHQKYPRIAVLFSKVTVPTPTQFQTDVRWCQIWISLKGKGTKTEHYWINDWNLQFCWFWKKYNIYYYWWLSLTAVQFKTVHKIYLTTKKNRWYQLGKCTFITLLHTLFCLIRLDLGTPQIAIVLYLSRT